MDPVRRAAEGLRREIKRSLGSYPKATNVRLEDLECVGLRIAVRYHDTDVVKLYLDKSGTKVCSIVLNSGGWHTKTTADRMNSVLYHLRVGFFVRHSYKRHQFVFGGAPRQMGDSIYDQKLTLVEAVGGEFVEYPMRDGVVFRRRGKVFCKPRIGRRTLKPLK